MNTDPWREMFLTTVRHDRANVIAKTKDYIGFTKFADLAAIQAGLDLGINLDPVEVEAIADILIEQRRRA
jgi:hypothetical protein